MSMKKKIRKAYESATPNVLDRVLQEIPAGEDSKEKTVQLPTENPSKMPHWLRETMATAAAFALLFSLIGGTVWYGVNHRNDQSGIDPSGNATGEHVIGTMSESDIVNSLWGEVYPDFPQDESFTEEFQKENTTVETLTKDGTDIYRITICYKGYTYLFEVDCKTGEIYTIEIPATDSVKEGYLAEGVVSLIVMMEHNAQNNNGDGSAWETEMEVIDDSYYRVTFIDNLDKTETIYYVDARTGELLELTDVGDPVLTAEEATEILRLHFDLDPASPVETELMEAGNLTYYRITVTDVDTKETHPYYVEALTGEILDVDVSAGDLVKIRDQVLDFVDADLFYALQVTVGANDEGYFITVEYGGALFILEISSDGTWQQLVSAEAPIRSESAISSVINYVAARKTALDHMGASIDTMTEFTYIYDVAAQAYYMTLTCGDVSNVYIIDAHSGEMQYCSGDSSISTILTEREVWDAVLQDEKLPELARTALENETASTRECRLTADEERIFYAVDLITGSVEYTAEVDVYDGTILSSQAIVPENYDQITYFQSLLSNYKSWYNMALTITYDSPEELDLYRFFYNGFDGEHTMTDEEWEALKDVNGFDEHFDFFRLPVEKMDEVLMEYFGITVDDVQATKTDGMAYLASTDCYYTMHTDFWCCEGLLVLSVEDLSDGTIEVTYTSSNDYAMKVVILKPVGDGYQILSNVLAE